MAEITLNTYAVNENDTPNEGRIKWNASIANLIADRTNFVRADSTTGVIGNINLNGQRNTNSAPAVDDNDTPTFIQVKEYSNKPFGYHQIYVQPQLDSTYVEYIYADGTTNLYAIRCGSLPIAVDNIPSDSTTVANAWTINLYGGQHDLDVDNLVKVVHIEGYSNPTINVSSTVNIANNVILSNKGTTRNCTIRCYQATDNPIALTLYEGIYKDNILHALVDGSYTNDSSIVVKSAVVVDSDLVATSILMDSTALNGMIDNCRMTADLLNWENNISSATNKVVAELGTILNLS